MLNLPKSLEREPLVEALFEVRLIGVTSLADALPGLLFQEFDPKPTVKWLPGANIPLELREKEQSLRFVPAVRFEWEKHSISIGTQNILINCKLPYPKWQEFKGTIVDVTKRISRLVEAKVERYSIRYVNMIAAPTLSEQIKKINMDIVLGDVKVESDYVNLKIQRSEDGIVHNFVVITNAEGTLPSGDKVQGVVVDIDSVCNVDNSPNFADFSEEFQQDLEKLKQANKVKFFECLTETTLKEMEPTYA